MTTSNSTRRASINLATTRLVDRAEGKSPSGFFHQCLAVLTGTRALVFALHKGRRCLLHQMIKFRFSLVKN